jgi:hypothetical protein
LAEPEPPHEIDDALHCYTPVGVNIGGGGKGQAIDFNPCPNFI